MISKRPGWALAAMLLMGCKVEASSARPTVESAIAAAGRSTPREPRAVLLGTVACISVRRCVTLITTLAGKPLPKVPDVLLDARFEMLFAEVDGKTIPGIRLSGGDGAELRVALERIEEVVGSTWVIQNVVETSVDSVVVSSSPVVAKTFASEPPPPIDARPDATVVAHVDSSKLSHAQRDRLVSAARAIGDAAESGEFTAQSFRQMTRSDQWISYLESNVAIDASLRHDGKTLSFDATLTPESGSPLQLDYQRASEASSRSASVVPYASAFYGSLVVPVPLDELDVSETQETIGEARLVLPIIVADAPAEYRPALIENGASLLNVLEDEITRNSHAELDLAANIVVEQAPTLSAAFTGFAKAGYPQLVRLTDTLARAYPQPWVTALEAPVRDYDLALFEVDLAAVLPLLASYFGDRPRAALGASHEMLWFSLGVDPVAALDRLHERAQDTPPEAAPATVRLHYNFKEAMSASPKLKASSFEHSLVVDLQSKNYATHNETTGSFTISGWPFIQGFVAGFSKGFGL